MSQEPLENVYAVPSPARLKLLNIRGSVQIRTGKDGEISIQAVKRSDSGDASNTEIIMEQSPDGTVRVETRFYHPFIPFFTSGPCKVDYTVQVPRNCDLQINGVSNSFEAEGLVGDFHITTVSGGIRLKEMYGSMKINSVSGSISGESLSGNMSFDTVSGGVRITEANFPQISGSTVSGSVSIQTPLSDGPYRFTSVSGDVHLVVPEGTSCTMSVSGMSGRLKTTLPVSRRSKDWAETAGGGPSVSLSAVSGSLWVDTQAGVQETPPPQPEKAETREILERIERGEISVDEGIALLKK